MGRWISSKDYDQNILKEGLKFQIDNYYKPVLVSQKRRIDIVLGLLKPEKGDMIIDVGCGAGTFVYWSALAKARAFGLDYSQESLRAAKELSGQFNTAESSDFLAASVLHMPFKDASFDKAVIADFIEHITDKEKDLMLKEVLRVLKPEGQVVIFTPNLIREKLGEFYHRIRNILFKTRIPKTDLHYGLISRKNFEKILKANGLRFEFAYADTTRPYLAKIPLINKALALNLVWKIKK